MKLKLTEREKVLLLVAGACLFAAIIYYAVIIPQLEFVNKLEKQAADYRIVINEVKAKASLDNPLYEEYEGVDEKTKELLMKYYPSIIQEKIILLLNEKINNSAIKMKSISFTEPTLIELNQLDEKQLEEENELEELVKQLYSDKQVPKQPQESNEASKSETTKVDKMTVTITFTGSYSQIFDFFKAIEQENKSIGCSILNITSDNSEVLSGTATLDFYAIPKPFDQDEKYTKWDIKGDYGKENPFK